VDTNFLLLTVSPASAFWGKSVEGIYGREITVKKTTKIQDIVTNSESYLGKVVKVEGELFDVCQEMGCWFSIKDKTGAIYVDLYMGVEFALPKKANGHHAVVEGIVTNEGGRSTVKLKASGVRIIED